MKFTMLLCFVVLSRAAPDKLSKDTKAPAHAASSSAARSLAGQTPANVGLLPQARPSPGQQQQQSDVQREESVSFKELNGETIRVVAGNYGYQSPEGLPVSVKYSADENGNKASFTIGAAASGSGSKPGGGGGSKRPGSGAGGGGSGKTGPGGAASKGNQSGKNTASPDGDRKYLPPN